MMKFSSVIINLFYPPANVFKCEHYSGENIWGTILAKGKEMKIETGNIMRQATLEEMAKAFDYRYEGRNSICLEKNQSITDNM